MEQQVGRSSGLSGCEDGAAPSSSGTAIGRELEFASQRPTEVMRRTGIPFAVAITAAAMSSACGSAPSTPTSMPPASGIIVGTVTADPTCPVEQAGHPCPPRPVSGVVSARRTDGTTLTAAISKRGTYRITVPAGTYTLNVSTGALLPRCPPAMVSASAGATALVDISCDTGIR